MTGLTPIMAQVRCVYAMEVEMVDPFALPLSILKILAKFEFRFE